MRWISGYPLRLGHAGDLRDVPALLAAGVGAVVDLAMEEPPALLGRTVVYCRFPLVDGTGNPPWMLRSAVEIVEILLRVGVSSLVSCGAGLSRSPAVAGVALARVRGFSAEQGLKLAVKSGVSDVSPVLWAEILAATA